MLNIFQVMKGIILSANVKYLTINKIEMIDFYK